MWFLDQIISWLTTIKFLFRDAYYEVASWVYPFNLLAPPLWDIYYGFIYLVIYFRDFRDWVNDTAIKLTSILSYANIYAYFEPYFTSAIGAWNWVVNAGWNILNVIEGWWNTASVTVQSWIDSAKQLLLLLINELELSLIALQAAWDSFIGMIPSINEIISWWANAWGWILEHILAWGGLSSTSILDLILSTLREWFPWYDTLAEIWDEIVAFFVDPWGYLEAKVVNWWLGPE